MTTFCSPDALIVKLSDGSTVGHVPDLFLHVFTPMLDSGEIHMSGTTNGVPRAAPERHLHGSLIGEHRSCTNTGMYCMV